MSYFDFPEADDFLQQIPDSRTFFSLKKIADHQGLADVQFLIGLCFEVGKWVSKSYKKAFQYYKLAADQGYGQAQAFLALLYIDGLGIDQDPHEALHYAKLAADHGNSDGLALLGRLYAEGKGVEKSSEEAIRYYQMAADLGNPIAFSYLADAFENGVGVEKSEEKANFFYKKKFEYCKKRADQGSPESQALVGWLFKNGIGTEKSQESALHYYQLSADQNCAVGQYYLGEYFTQGNEIQKASEKAIHYFKLAADQGNVLAKFSLAQYFLKNKKDQEKAVRYFQSILQKQQGDSDLLASCEYNLAKCFEKGIGVKKSIQDALRYYQLSSDHGNDSAQDRLGDAYLKGELGLTVSLEKAVELYQLAADQGNVFAIMTLGECHEKGTGIEQSDIKAFQYYRLAGDISLEEGLSLPLYKLAICYENGTGTERSLEKAIHYYKLAGENGFIESYHRMSCCLKELGGEENERKAEAYLKIAEAGKKMETEEKITSMKSQHGFRSLQQFFFINKQSIQQLEEGKDNVELILDFRKNDLISDETLKALEERRFGTCNAESGKNEFKFPEEYLGLIEKGANEGRLTKIVLLKSDGQQIIDVDSNENFLEKNIKSTDCFTPDKNYVHVSCDITDNFPGLKNGERAYLTFLHEKCLSWNDKESIKIMPIHHFNPWSMTEERYKKILNSESLAVYVTSSNEKTAVYLTEKCIKKLIRDGMTAFCYSMYFTENESRLEEDEELYESLTESPENCKILILPHERPIEIFSKEQYKSINKICSEIMTCTKFLGKENIAVGGIFLTLNKTMFRQVNTFMLRSHSNNYLKVFLLTGLETNENSAIFKIQAIDGKNVHDIQEWEKNFSELRLIGILKNENGKKQLLVHQKILEENQIFHNGKASIAIELGDGKYIINNLGISLSFLNDDKYKQLFNKINLDVKDWFN